MAFDGLYEAKTQGLSRQGCAIYLYHSLFDVAGTPCSETSVVPNIIPVLYNTWPVYIQKVVDRLYPRSQPTQLTGQQLYQSILRDAGLSQKKEDLSAALGTGNDSDEEFAFLRLLALSRWQFSTPHLLKKAFSEEKHETLRNELSGKVEGPQIMLYYSPDLVQKTLFSDAAMKTRVEAGVEEEGYGALVSLTTDVSV